MPENLAIVTEVLEEASAQGENPLVVTLSPMANRDLLLHVARLDIVRQQDNACSRTVNRVDFR